MTSFLVKRLTQWISTPSYATDGSAGIDLRAVSPCVIPPGETMSVRTGFNVAIPHGHFGLVLGRSGLAFKHGIYCAHVGTIDSDYRGEIAVLLTNHSKEHFRISADDRIAQLVIMPFARCTVVETDKLPSTERGEGGFGSTGR